MTDTFVGIDLETTGLNPKLDKIIEIGAVKVVRGQFEDNFSTLVNPDRKLEEKAAELTGITDEMLRDAPYIEDVLPQFLDFLGDLPLLGHNVLFDYSFLKKVAVNQKLVFEKEAIDTLKIARKYLASLERRNLDFLCQYYGIPHHAHRALGDAQAACVLYERLAEQFYTADEKLFTPQKLHYAAKRDTPITKPQKERLYRILQQHKIILDINVEKLTRSEADRIIDKILEAYGR